MARDLGNRLKPVAIVGPTASGKTAAAVELAKRTTAEIISADSMAIYRGLDIGTAKPTPEEMASAVFHMVDVVDPNAPFTVADFEEQSAEIVDDLLDRNVLPLIVGGTGLYVRALIDGLNIPGPGPNPELRERLLKVAAEKGNDFLHAELVKVDPKTAKRLHPNDLKRVIRALEVFEQSGAPMSEIVEQTRRKESRYPDAVLFGLTMDRAKLYQRIEIRVDRLIEAGLVEEVKGLLDKGYDVDLPSMQGLGYKEIVGYLKGECDLQSAIDLLKRDTRRFAKRQYTWFRADKRIEWIDIDNLSAPEVADLLEARLREHEVFMQGE